MYFEMKNTLKNNRYHTPKHRYYISNIILCAMKGYETEKERRENRLPTQNPIYFS